MNTPTALLLVGSPKGKASTSRSIGISLLRRLEAGGTATEEMAISAGLRSTEDRNGMLAAVDAADLLVVSFPLYVDQLPAPLVEALELIADHRNGAARTEPRARRLAVIVQCGFPETLQNQPAVDIMRRFAKEAGFVWAGALAIGMGGAIGGKSLDKAGGMARNVVKALDAAALSLAAGGLIPEEATALAGKPLMPKWLYLVAANYGMKSLARKHGVGKRAYDRPYAP